MHPRMSIASVECLNLKESVKKAILGFHLLRLLEMK